MKLLYGPASFRFLFFCNIAGVSVRGTKLAVYGLSYF